MAINIALIVEGHGEREAAPILLRRIARQIDPRIVVNIPAPLRIPRSRLIKPGEIERAVEFAARTIGGHGAVFILLDSDDDCPAELGPALLQRARQTRGDVALAVVVAKREFEAWFLAAAVSLRGQRGLANDAQPPADPEAIRGAKEWLAARMAGAHYSETLDQPAFAALFDLEAARRTDSFDKCFREAQRVLTEPLLPPREAGD